MLERPYPGRLRGLVIGFGWAYGHLVLYAALAMTAVGVELAIEEGSHAHLAGGARAALGGGLALSLVAIVALRSLSPPPPRSPVVAAGLAAAAVILGLAAAGAGLAPPVLAGLLAVVAVALTAFESTFPVGLGEPGGVADAAERGA